MGAAARGPEQERHAQAIREGSPEEATGELRSGADGGVSQTEEEGCFSVTHWHCCQELEGTDTDLG